MIDVLHINSYYESSIFYKGLYDKQAEQGLNIKVYVPSSGDKGLRHDYGNYTDVSYCFKEIDRYVFHLKHNKILKDIVKNYDFSDVKKLHAHSLFSNGYIAYRLKKKYGIPYIVAVRNTDINTFFAKMIHLRKLGLSILKEAEKVIFISHSYYKKLEEHYIPADFQREFKEKAVVIPNGVNQFYIDNCATSKKATEDKIRLLYVGEINQNKNVEFTVNCLKDKNVQLDIVGKISNKKIFDRIKNQKIVSYHSPMNKEQLLKMYRESDIFVMPSITETFGLVYVEAMSQGTPVIYTKGQGFDGQFPEGVVGYSMRSDSSTELENAIQAILANYEQISKNCIEGSKRFSWTHLEREYYQIYEQM